MIRTAIVRFTDNQTGTGDDIPVAASGHQQSVAELLSKTKLGQDGSITSIELVHDFENVELSIFSSGTLIGKLDGNGDNSITFQSTPTSELTVSLSVINPAETAEA